MPSHDACCTLARSARLLAVHAVQRCDAPRVLAVHSPGLALLQGPHSGALKRQTSRRSVLQRFYSCREPQACAMLFRLRNLACKRTAVFMLLVVQHLSQTRANAASLGVCAHPQHTSLHCWRGAGQNGAHCAVFHQYYILRWMPSKRNELSRSKSRVCHAAKHYGCFVVRIATADCCLLFPSS